MNDFIDSFIEQQQRALADGALDPFLRRMVALFRELGTSPALQGKHLPSSIFDTLCQAAGQRSAFELRQHYPAPAAPHNVILVTEMVVMGGHAEVVKDLLRTSTLPVVLLASNLNERKEAVLDSLATHPAVAELIVADDLTLLDKLRTLQVHLADPAVQHIYVLTHGYDAVGIAAITPAMATHTSFLHHCDHTPALGNYLPGARHVDLHNLAFQRCRHEHNITENAYLCLTSAGPSLPAAARPFATPYFVSASCGGYQKLSTLDYPLSYIDLVCRVLRARDGVHFHIGTLPAHYLNDMAAALRRDGIDPERFCHLGQVPDLASMLVQLDVDVYLPTLPQSGGKAIVDAMAAGLPIVLHQHARDRQSGSCDLAYPSAPAWRDWQELDAILDNFDANFQAEQATASRAYFDQYHSERVFRRQLATPGGVADVAPLKPYWPDTSAFLALAGFRASPALLTTTP